MVEHCSKLDYFTRATDQEKMSEIISREVRELRREGSVRARIKLTDTHFSRFFEDQSVECQNTGLGQRQTREWKIWFELTDAASLHAIEMSQISFHSNSIH